MLVALMARIFKAMNFSLLVSQFYFRYCLLGWVAMPLLLFSSAETQQQAAGSCWDWPNTSWQDLRPSPIKLYVVNSLRTSSCAVT